MAEVSKRARSIALNRRQGDIFKKLVNSNKFDKERNPTGVIDLGSADNKLCEDLILNKLCSPEAPVLTADQLYYDIEDGMPVLKDSIVGFLKTFFKAKDFLTSDNLVITAGLHSGLENLVFSIADTGDTLLTPTPFWDKVPKILTERCGVLFEEVPLSRENGYSLTVKSLEHCYSKALSEGKKVKGIFLINPNNPLGVVHEKEELCEILHFAKKFELHVILDEVYALCSHTDDTSSVHSALALDTLPDPQRTHIAWSMSKDFGMSGYRTGVLISWNEQMLSCLKSLAHYNVVPSPMQVQVAWLLRQHDWLRNSYLPTLRSRLRERCAVYQGKLESLGAAVFPPQAGLYIWTNLSKFLDEPTFDAEHRLLEKCIQVGVYFRPGRIFHAHSPGHIRFVFTHQADQLDEGFKRLQKALLTPDKLDILNNPKIGIDVGLDDLEIIGAATSGGSSESVEDLVKTLQKCIKESDWLNPSVPQRDAQERVWTILEPGADSQASGTEGNDPPPESSGPDGGSTSLDDMMRSLQKSISPEWLSSHKGQWELENPEAAEEYRKVIREDCDKKDSTYKD